MVTESDSGPTSVSSPLVLDPATVTPLTFPDSGPIAAITLTPPPEASAPVAPQPAPAAFGLPEPAAPQRRMVLGIGMGLGIVALLVLGVSVLRHPKPHVAPAAPVPVAAQEPLPPVPADEPAPPAPAPEAAAPQRASKPVAAEPVAHRGGTRGVHERAVTAHHGKAHRPHATRTRKIAMRERAGKPEVAPSPPAEQPDPRAPYERGNKLLFAGDSKGAIAAYREAVKAAPKDPIGFRGLGLAYEHEGEAAKAIKSLRRYLKLAPNAADHDLIVRRIDRLSKAAKK